MIKLVDILKEDNHLITFDKKNDEKFYRKVLNYVVENLGNKLINNVKSYIYCRELYCLPLTQTTTYKIIDDFLNEELQLKTVERIEIFLLLIFNIDTIDFLRSRLDLGEGYKLYYVLHTAQAIDTLEDWEQDDCQMCDGEGELKYECGYCDGEGTVNLISDTPQECQECRGDGYTISKCEDCRDGIVENQIIEYRLDYHISSFLTEKKLIIPDGEFSLKQFIDINKDNNIIFFTEKDNGYEIEDIRRDLSAPGMVYSLEEIPHFSIHDLDVVHAIGRTKLN